MVPIILVEVEYNDNCKIVLLIILFSLLFILIRFVIFLFFMFNESIRCINEAISPIIDENIAKNDTAFAVFQSLTIGGKTFAERSYQTATAYKNFFHNIFSM